MIRSDRLVEAITSFAQEKKAIDVVVLDLREVVGQACNGIGACLPTGMTSPCSPFAFPRGASRTSVSSRASTTASPR